jgi:hypothetical protein
MSAKPHTGRPRRDPVADQICLQTYRLQTPSGGVWSGKWILGPCSIGVLKAAKLNQLMLGILSLKTIKSPGFITRGHTGKRQAALTSDAKPSQPHG